MGYVYWCAACGNPEIIIENEKRGYSMSKGLVGAAVLGPVGAIAGIDGKEQTVFYCPKCGARLHHSMPDWEVNHILDLLQHPESSKALLEQKREKYPNMLWPYDGEKPAFSSDGRVKMDAIQNMTQDQIEEIILDYLQDQRTPVSFEGDFFKKIVEGYTALSEGFDALWDAFNNANKSGRLGVEYIDGVRYIVLPKNDQERYAYIQKAKLREKAPRILLDNKKSILSIVAEKGPVSKEDIHVELVKRQPTINDENEFTSEYLVEGILPLLVKDSAISRNEEMCYTATSSFEKEREYIKKYKAETEVKAMDKIRYQGRIAYFQDTIDYLSGHPNSSVNQLCNNVPGLTNTQRSVGQMKSLLRALIDRGDIVCKNDLYSKAPDYEKNAKHRAIKEVGLAYFGEKGSVEAIKEILTRHEDGLSTDSIISEMEARENIIEFFKQDISVFRSLALLECLGEVKNSTFDGVSYWRIYDEKKEKEKAIKAYWDEHKEQKEKYESELSELKQKKWDLQKEYNEKKVLLNTLKIPPTSKVPAEAEVIQLNERITSLTEKRKSLSIFKNKQKKALDQQIIEAQAELVAAEAKQNEQVAQQNEEWKRQIDQVKDEMRKLDLMIKPLDNDIQRVEKRLKRE